MKECDNIKIHINNKFIFSISLLMMFDTLLFMMKKDNTKTIRTIFIF